MRKLIGVFLFLIVQVGIGQTTYYSQGDGLDATDVSIWNNQADGSGASPIDFTNPLDIFIVQNGDALNTSNQWIVAGLVKIETGSGNGSIDNGGFDNDITLDMEAGATYIQTGLYSLLKFGTIDPGSIFSLQTPVVPNLRYNLIYPTLSLDGNPATGGLTLGNNLTMTGSLNINFPVFTRVLNISVATSRTLKIGGDCNINSGTLRVSNGAAFSVLSVAGSINISSLGNLTLAASSGSPLVDVGGSFSQTGGTFNGTTATANGNPILRVNSNFTVSTGTYVAKVSGAGTGFPIVHLQGTGNISAASIVASNALHNISITGNYTQIANFIIGRTFSINGGTYNIGGNNTLTLGRDIVFLSGTLNGGTTSNMYFDNSAVASGLPSVSLGTLTVNRSGSTVSLIGSVTANNLDLVAGSLSILGNTLTINNQINATGSLVGGSTSSLVIGGGEGPPSTNIPTVSLQNFTLNRQNGCSFAGNVTVLGNLFLNRGIIDNGSFLTLANGATITRSSTFGTQFGILQNTPTFLGNINLTYSGSEPYTTGLEIPSAQPNGIINTLSLNFTGGSGLTLNNNNIQVNGILSISGASSTLNASTYNMNLLGNFVNNGTFNSNTGSVTFIGSSTISGTNAISFNNLSINSAGTGLTLNGGNNTVAGTLTFSNGTIKTGSNTLFIGSSGSTFGGSASSYVVGNLAQRIGTGTSIKTFDIGTSSQYAPITLTFSGVSTAGNLTTRTDIGNNPSIGSSTFNSELVARNWTFTNSGISPTNYDALFNFSAGEATGTTSTYRVGVFSGGVWSYSNAGVQNPTNTSGLVFTTLGTYQIGNMSALSSTTWQGVSSDWFNSANWSNGIPSLSLNAVIATVAGSIYPSISTTGAVCKNVTINASASLAILGSNELTVAGNWLNNGTFTGNQSKVILSGTGISIGGSSTTQFYDLQINANSTPSLASTIHIIGTLNIGSNATLVTTGQDLTFISNASGTARLGVMPTGASIVGNIKVQRFLKSTVSPKTRLNYQISPPILGATIATWQNAFYVTGTFTGKSINTAVGISATSAASVFTFDANSGLFSAYPTTTSAAPLSIGVGYRAFIRDGGTASTFTGAKTIEVTGNPHVGDYTFPSLGFTTVGGLGGGWQMIGNPYPSEISGDLLDPSKWPVKTNVASAIYVWNPEGKCYNSYINGVSTSCDPSTSIFTSVIASSQTFWVQATASGAALSVAENAKTTSNGAFYRKESIDNLLFVQLKNSQNINETAIRFLSGATKNFDYNFDAHKLETGSGQSGSSSLLISSVVNNKTQALSINGRPELAAGVKDTVFLNILSGNGNDTLKFSGLASFSPNVEVSLIDNFLSTTTNLKSNPSYSFDVTSATGSKGNGRFSLIFDRIPEVLTISSDSIHFDNAIGIVSAISVVSNVNWQISPTQNWLMASSNTTLGNGLISISTINENPTIYPRFTVVTISGDGNITRFLKVTQAPMSVYLSLTDTALTIIDSISTTKNMGVISNNDWIVNSTSNWVSYTQKGNGNGLIVVSVAGENPSNTVYRKATISVSLTGTSIIKNFNVYQIPSKLTIVTTLSGSSLTGTNTTLTGTNSLTGLNIGDQEKLIIYPNPSKGDFILLNLSTKKYQNETINVLDYTGRKMAFELLLESNGLYKLKFQNSLLSGIYLLQYDFQKYKFIVE